MGSCQTIFRTITITIDGVAQWLGRQTRNRWMSVRLEPLSKARLVSLKKTLYQHYIVLVGGSMNGFERDLLWRNCIFHDRARISYYKLTLQLYNKGLEMQLYLASIDVIYKHEKLSSLFKECIFQRKYMV